MAVGTTSFVAGTTSMCTEHLGTMESRNLAGFFIVCWSRRHSPATKSASTEELSGGLTRWKSSVSLLPINNADELIKKDPKTPQTYCYKATLLTSMFQARGSDLVKSRNLSKTAQGNSRTGGNEPSQHSMTSCLTLSSLLL